ncbi:hypothetical protein CC1G_12179 [Coprinopsis cinerea okayama7|uniref:Uncharacterized protein n=1 Tax=Coprinopsis cinerea (strain Okayama-7 / 130 / ATCC MYA-4618 / FGSC 9003) TaxID=240176 RepID=A8NHN0_COPC7|nr:hypothetical protein CC1G_12179 [Coprinopsis cinerea okayama7\|eukprot:XP_001833797.2 hypothetical protein CC1G_12179 [Coprinopsis cinerea okayama7\
MESSGHTLDLDAIKREAQYVQEEPPEHRWRDPLTGQPTQEQLVHDLKERVSQLETEKAQSLGSAPNDTSAEAPAAADEKAAMWNALPSVLPKFASTRGFSMTTRKAAAAASSKPAGSSKTELEKSKKTAGVEKENTNKKERVEEKESESEEEEVDELQEEEEEPLRFVEVKRVGPPKKKKKVTWSDSQPTAKLTPSGTLPYVDVPPLSTKPLGAFKPKVNKEEEKSFEKEREVEEKGEPLPEIDRRGPAYNKRAPVEQNGAAKAIVNELLEVTVPVNIKSLMGVSPEAREYLKNLLTRKRVPTREVPIPRETEVFKRFFDDPHEVKRLHVGLQWVENSEEAMAKAEAVVEQRALAEKQNRDYKEASTLRPAVRTIAEKGDEKPLGSITISDPVEQYMIELGTEAKPVIVKAEESSSLRVIYPEINGAMKEESLLDGGSTICSMHEQAAKDHGLTWDPAVTRRTSSRVKGRVGRQPAVFSELDESSIDVGELAVVFEQTASGEIKVEKVFQSGHKSGKFSQEDVKLMFIQEALTREVENKKAAKKVEAFLQQVRTGKRDKSVGEVMMLDTVIKHFEQIYQQLKEDIIEDSAKTSSTTSSENKDEVVAGNPNAKPKIKGVSTGKKYKKVADKVRHPSWGL